MKNILACFCLCACLATTTYSQIISSPRPITAAPPPIEVRTYSEQQTRNQQQDLQRREKLNSDSLRPINNPYSLFIYNNTIPLYRKSTAAELVNIAPKSEDSTKFSDFLLQPDTGIIKLVADRGCSGNPFLVVATPDCLPYTMPGAGTSYSFRVKDYRLPRLADISLANNSLQAFGVNLHGFFVELGDVSLDQINLQTKGVSFAADLKAEPSVEKAKILSLQLDKGISDNGFLYSRSVEIKDNTTYVLRSIAYRGKFPRTIRGVSYNELEFDKRKDILVAFRIIRLENDSVTMLWKQLAKQDSPKAKLRIEK